MHCSMDHCRRPTRVCLRRLWADRFARYAAWDCRSSTEICRYLLPSSKKVRWNITATGSLVYRAGRCRAVSARQDDHGTATVPVAARGRRPFASAIRAPRSISGHCCMSPLTPTWSQARYVRCSKDRRARTTVKTTTADMYLPAAAGSKRPSHRYREDSARLSLPVVALCKQGR